MLTGKSYVVQTEYPGYRFTIEKGRDGIAHIICQSDFYLDVTKFIKDFGIKEKLESYEMTEDISITGTLYGKDILNNPLEVKGIRWAVDLVEFDGKVAGITAMLMLAYELDLELANYNVIGTNRLDTNSAINYYLRKINSKRYKTSQLLDVNDYGKAPVNVNVFSGSTCSLTKEELQLMADNNKYHTNNSYAKGINVKALRTLPIERFEIHNYKSQHYKNKKDERLAS